MSLPQVTASAASCLLLVIALLNASIAHACLMSHQLIGATKAAPQPSLLLVYLARAESQMKEGKLDEAADTLRQALKLPLAAQGRGIVYQRLGAILKKAGELPDALATFRAAVQEQPNNSAAHYELGLVLWEVDHFEAAEVSLRTVVRLEPDHAEAHYWLAGALLWQAKLREAHTFAQRAHELGKKSKDWPHRSRELLADAETALKLEDWLKKKPLGKSAVEIAGTTPEQVLFQDPTLYARLCTARGFYAVATYWYNHLFMSQDYVTACARVQAGCGLGVDAHVLDDERRKQYRQTALTDLQYRLERTEALLGANRTTVWEVRRTMHDFQLTPALSCVRDPAALAKLPAAERQEWQKFWQDVQQLLEKVRKRGP
jgi:tetratricopeptide (TPR) repeat protein